MDSKDTYSRKISAKEAQSEFIFIIKSKLPFFGEGSFELTDGDTKKSLRIKSYPCTCRGPERSHEHYFIPWKGLKAGDKIEITKNGSHQYSLKIY